MSSIREVEPARTEGVAAWTPEPASAGEPKAGSDLGVFRAEHMALVGRPHLALEAYVSVDATTHSFHTSTCLPYIVMAPDLQKALNLIDEAHAQDPTKVEIDGKSIPYELHYAQKSTSYLDKHTSSPTALLQTAVRAQHFQRWTVPRDSYPKTKPGYFAWRTYLKKRQGEQVKEICLQCSYSEEEASRVASLIAKEGLKKGEGMGDPEVQVLEDVACLVFLDDQFEAFEKEHDEDKIVDILRKTWVKMGKRGQDLALEMDLSPRGKELVGKALAS